MSHTLAKSIVNLLSYVSEINKINEDYYRETDHAFKIPSGMPINMPRITKLFNIGFRNVVSSKHECSNPRHYILYINKRGIVFNIPYDVKDGIMSGPLCSGSNNIATEFILLKHFFVYNSDYIGEWFNTLTPRTKLAAEIYFKYKDAFTPYLMHFDESKWTISNGFQEIGFYATQLKYSLLDIQINVIDPYLAILVGQSNSNAVQIRFESSGYQTGISCNNVYFPISDVSTFVVLLEPYLPKIVSLMRKEFDKAKKESAEIQHHNMTLIEEEKSMINEIQSKLQSILTIKTL